MLNIPALQAEERLAQATAGARLGGEEVYRIVLDITGDEDEADKCRAELLMAQMRADEQPVL